MRTLRPFVVPRKNYQFWAVFDGVSPAPTGNDSVEWAVCRARGSLDAPAPKALEPNLNCS